MSCKYKFDSAFGFWKNINFIYSNISDVIYLGKEMKAEPWSHEPQIYMQTQVFSKP